MLAIILLVILVIFAIVYVIRWIWVAVSSRRGQQSQGQAQAQGQQPQAQQHEQQQRRHKEPNGLDPSLIESLPLCVLGTSDAQGRLALEFLPEQQLLRQTTEDEDAGEERQSTLPDGFPGVLPPSLEALAAASTAGGISGAVAAPGAAQGRTTGESAGDHRIDIETSQSGRGPASARPATPVALSLPANGEGTGSTSSQLPSSTQPSRGAEPQEHSEGLGFSVQGRPLKPARLPAPVGAADLRRVGQAGGLKECPVCLADYRSGDIIKWLPRCGHAFHAACIDAWLRSNCTCPLCRQEVGPAQHEDVPRSPS